MRLGTLVIAALVVAAGAAAQNAPVPVPSGDYLASELTSGTLFVLSPSGREVWSVPRPIADYGAEGIALTKDRRVAYVSVLRRDDQPPNLYAVDLSTGAKRVVARGVDPALSPDGAKLAYHHTVLARVGDYWVIDGLAIRDLQTGATRLIPEPVRATAGSDALNWSPDARTIAVYDGQRVRLVDVATAKDLSSQPSVPGDVPGHPISPRVYPPAPLPAPPGGHVVRPAPPPSPTTSTSRAPVFLDGHTLVVVYDCCVGSQHLVAFDLRTGRHTPFATLYGPPVNVSRIEPGALLVVTAAHLLVVATKAHTRLVAANISAAAG